MTWGQAKKIILNLIEEYSSTSLSFTDDEDIATRLPFIFYTAYQEMSQYKPIHKTVELDRSSIGTTEYYREYSLPADMYKLQTIYTKDATTNKIIDNGDFEWSLDAKTVSIDDRFIGKVFVEYTAFPTVIDDTTLDTFVLEISDDATVIACYTTASDILKTDISSDYVGISNERNRRLAQLSTSLTDNFIQLGKEITLD